MTIFMPEGQDLFAQKTIEGDRPAAHKDCLLAAIVSETESAATTAAEEYKDPENIVATETVPAAIVSIATEA